MDSLEQPLVNSGRDKPDTEACAKRNPQGQLPAKTQKGHKEKRKRSLDLDTRYQANMADFRV